MARKRIVFGVAVVALVAVGACTLIGGSFEVDPSLDTNVGVVDGGGLGDGGGTSPDAAADSGCGDVRIDRKNCGACGVDCLEGQCLEGRCTPYTVATMDGGVVGDLALFGDDIWATYIPGPNGGQLVRMTGGKVIDDATLGDAGVTPTHLTVAQLESGFVLYWTSSADGKKLEIRRCALPECTNNVRLFGDKIEEVAEYQGLDGDPEAVLATGRPARFVSCNVGTTTCTVSAYDAGVTPGVFSSAVINRKPGLRAAFLAPGARRVFALKEIVPNASLSELASQQVGVNALALDGAHVVWVGVDDGLPGADKGYVRRCADTAVPCKVEEIAHDPFEPKNVQIVGDVVVWTSVFPGQPLQGGAVRACNLKSGCKDVVTLANGEPNARDITGDDKGFVWTSTERVGTTGLHHVRRVVLPVSQRP